MNPTRHTSTEDRLAADIASRMSRSMGPQQPIVEMAYATGQALIPYLGAALLLLAFA